MLRRLAIVLGIIAAMVLWFQSYPVPGWALIAFVVALFVIGVALSVKRLRAERRVMRTFWAALTGR